MTDQYTFSIIKPDAVAKGYTGAIINKITEAGFTLIALRMVSLTYRDAELFYSVHAEKPFYNGLINFMISGPVVVMILKKDDAVNSFRKLLGATNPAEAAEGTLRKTFGENGQKNALHGSDSDVNAMNESNYFFTKLDRFEY